MSCFDKIQQVDTSQKSISTYFSKVMPQGDSLARDSPNDSLARDTKKSHSPSKKIQNSLLSMWQNLPKTTPTTTTTELTTETTSTTTEGTIQTTTTTKTARLGFNKRRSLQKDDNKFLPQKRKPSTKIETNNPKRRKSDSDITTQQTLHNFFSNTKKGFFGVLVIFL